jgi:predicted anti-sigma-YlaC factor YlaD
MIGCDAAREAAPELALDVLDGAERARVLHHLESCPSCRAHLRDLAGTVDALLGLAPPVASPEVRTARRRRPRRLAVGAAVAAVLAVVLGTVVVKVTTGGPPAERIALARPSGEPVGYVVVGGRHVEAWVERPLDATAVGCRFTLADGRVVLAGPFTLHGGTGWWKVERPEAGVRTLELVDGDRVVAIARFG